jgi:adenylate cyclase
MFRVTVTNKKQAKEFVHTGGPLEFGRGPKRSAERFMILDLFVSRDQVSVEELRNGWLRLENLGNTNPITLSTGLVIEPKAVVEQPLPVIMTIGETTIKLEASERPSLLHVQTIARPAWTTGHQEIRSTLAGLGSSPSFETLTTWFETVIAVQRSAAGSKEFFQETAHALVELVGLDRGLVLLRRTGGWDVAAGYPPGSADMRHVSGRVLDQVVTQKQTFFQSLESASVTGSLKGLDAFVASPVLDPENEVVGVLYGARSLGPHTRRLEVQRLEAQVVQLLAAAVSAGLARLDREAEAARTRIQFEQFFSPELSRELTRDPSLLEGRMHDVTVLFSDLRGFSKIAEKLPPSETYRIMEDILDRLTERVLEHEGVIVDYVGDGMLAMWNAPVAQADHAQRACRAALSMLSDVPALSSRWKDFVGGNLSLGIGINSGPAQVGNAGSRRRFKYGPRGHTVNLASRVEGATKRVGVSALLTGSTRELIGDDLPTRRLFKIRAHNMTAPVDLYELHTGPPTDHWLSRRDAYERALRLYETGRLDDALSELERMSTSESWKHDQPTLQLLAHVRQAHKKHDPTYDSIWDFDAK